MRRERSAKVLPQYKSDLVDSVLTNTPGTHIFRCDSNHIIVEMEGDVEGVTGYCKEELIGKPCIVSNSMTKSDLDTISVRNTLYPGKPIKLHTQFVNKNGQFVSAELIFTINHDGAWQGLAIKNGYADDWQEIISTAHAPIFGVNEELNVNEWNIMAETITGYSKEEVLNKPFLDLIENEYREPVGIVLYKCLKGENTANYQQQLKTKSGDTRVLMINATSRCSQGNPVGVIGIAQDITDLVKLQEKELQIQNQSWMNNLLTIFKGFNQAYVWEYYLDLEGTTSGFRAVSDGCLAITGHTPKEILNNPDSMRTMLTEESFCQFCIVVEQYTKNPHIELEETYKYSLRNNKRISINVIPIERSTSGITFVGITIDLPEESQLDLILECSEDLIMIDDGPEQLINYIISNNLSELSAKDIVDKVPKKYYPKVLYCSPAWKKFNWNESPVGMVVSDLQGGDTDTQVENQGLTSFVEGILMGIKEGTIQQSQTIRGTVNGINVESILSPMGTKILSVTRNIEDRIEKQRLQLEVAKQQVAREKDEQANAFDRHETKNGLLSASAQVDVLMRIHKQADKDLTLEKQEHREEVYSLYNDLAYDLDQTLQTVLSNAMTREIIHNTYKPKYEPYDILSAKHRIKGDNYVWNVYPRHIPEIMTDEALLFYIMRNAISNANKYGAFNGIVTISISIKNTTLEIKVENLPGDKHDELLKVMEPNVIFERGVRFHDKTQSTQRGARSAGDGAWIMSTCAKLLKGSVNIKFTKLNTEFTFTTQVATCITNDDIMDFSFPLNTEFYIIDDSRMQRKMMERSIKSLGIPEENIYIRGADMNEILSLETFLTSKLQILNKYFVIICDENLDYKDTRGELGTILGSKMWEGVKHKIDESRVLFYTRSANDSSVEVEEYLKIADGVISKKISRPDDLRKIIAHNWLEKIGIAIPTDVKSTFNNDLGDIIDIYMEDLNEFLLLEKTKCTWDVFWAELHKIKGSIQSLNEIINSDEIVRMIESLRGNNFDTTYEERWEIVKYGITDYHKKILTYLQSHGDNQIST